MHGERGVGEMLQARGIFSHDIVSSWEETGLVAVAMLALVGAGIVAEVSGGAVAGDGTVGHSGHCWSAVRCVNWRGWHSAHSGW